MDGLTESFTPKMKTKKGTKEVFLRNCFNRNLYAAKHGNSLKKQVKYAS